MFLKISKKSQKNNCARVSFLIKLQAGSLQLYQTKTPAEMFSCEFCENIRVFILKNIADDYFYTKEISVLCKKFNDQNAKWVSYCKKLLGKY